jgi:hypothetical protein
VDKEGRELYTLSQSLQRHQEDVLQTKGRVIKSCIQNRAQIHVEAARDEYERARRMMGKRALRSHWKSSVSLQMYSIVFLGIKQRKHLGKVS